MIFEVKEDYRHIKEIYPGARINLKYKEFEGLVKVLTVLPEKTIFEATGEVGKRLKPLLIGGPGVTLKYNFEKLKKK